VLNDEEKKHIMEYEGKEMMESDGGNRASVHVHVYNTLTDSADSHQHVVMGVSSPADIVGRSHAHSICIRTSFVEGHWHWVDIMTDRALVMPGDTHSHYFADSTSMNDGHFHKLSNLTNLSPDLCIEAGEQRKLCKYKYKRPEDEEYN